MLLDNSGGKVNGGFVWGMRGDINGPGAWRPTTLET